MGASDEMPDKRGCSSLEGSDGGCVVSVQEMDGCRKRQGRDKEIIMDSQTIYYDIGDERDLTPEEVEGLLLEDVE